MLTLPRGITGFDASACADSRQFHADLYAATRFEGVAISQPPIDHPDDVRTYISAFITVGETNLVVLLNVYASWVAFSHAPESVDAAFRFLDIPIISRHLERYTVPHADFLESAISGDSLSGLSNAELKQVRYWKPIRMGDVVYNTWD